jgi:hypothetical protein
LPLAVGSRQSIDRWSSGAVASGVSMDLDGIAWGSVSQMTGQRICISISNAGRGFGGSLPKAGGVTDGGKAPPPPADNFLNPGFALIYGIKEGRAKRSPS